MYPYNNFNCILMKNLTNKYLYISNYFFFFRIFNVSLFKNLLPPKLQRRGLVFKGKMGYYGA